MGVRHRGAAIGIGAIDGRSFPVGECIMGDRRMDKGMGKKGTKRGKHWKIGLFEVESARG
jgi:hypothetical protein